MRRLLTIFLSGLFFLMTVSCVYASTPQNVQKAFDNVPQEVQQAANDGIKNFYGDINNQKSGYGLSETDNAETATLGMGHAVYHPSINTVEDYANKKIAVPSSSQLLTKIDSYVFPINVGIKPAGVMFVEMFEGKWQAVTVTNYLDFQKDLKNAQDNLNNILGPQTSPSAVKLVYATSIHLIALSAEGTSNDFMIPLQDNSTLGFVKNQKISTKDLADKLSKLYINNKNANNNSSNLRFGGYGGLTTVMKNSSWGWISFIIIIFGVVSIVLGKKKLAQK